MLNIKGEIRIIPLIANLLWISGPNTKQMIPLLRFRVGTLKSMEYSYSSMFFAKKLVGNIYYTKSAYSARVLKEEYDPTHPQSTYSSAVADREEK